MMSFSDNLGRVAGHNGQCRGLFLIFIIIGIHKPTRFMFTEIMLEANINHLDIRCVAQNVG